MKIPRVSSALCHECVNAVPGYEDGDGCADMSTLFPLAPLPKPIELQLVTGATCSVNKQQLMLVINITSTVCNQLQLDGSI